MAIIYEYREVLCAYVYDFSLNKQTNKKTDSILYIVINGGNMPLFYKNALNSVFLFKCFL